MTLLTSENKKNNKGNDWNPKWKCVFGNTNWVLIKLHPLIIEERIPYQPIL